MIIVRYEREMIVRYEVLIFNGSCYSLILGKG